MKQYLRADFIWFWLLNLLLGSNIPTYIASVVFSFYFLYNIGMRDSSPKQIEFVFISSTIILIVVLLIFLFIKLSVLPFFLKKIERLSKDKLFEEFVAKIRSNKAPILIISLTIDSFFILLFNLILFRQSFPNELVLTTAAYLVSGMGLFGSYLVLFAWWIFIDWRKKKIIAESPSGTT